MNRNVALGFRTDVRDDSLEQIWYNLENNTYERGNIMPDIKYEITKAIGELSTSPKGWTKELNMVSWNDREPKFDLREWDPGHERMGKGITLSLEEMKKLKELLAGIDI